MPPVARLRLVSVRTPCRWDHVLTENYSLLLLLLLVLLFVLLVVKLAVSNHIANYVSFAGHHQVTHNSYHQHQQPSILCNEYLACDVLVNTWRARAVFLVTLEV
jgi:hypothetical protein